jgi:dTDP-4-dehydrorhamnose 3,5-epimerase
VKFTPTRLPEVILVQPDVHRDARGFFLESFHAEKYRANGIDAVFVQDNHSASTRGTLRGLHAQWRRPQGKLVRVLQGEIFDVAVDARLGSPRFGQWIGVTLSHENHHQLWVPGGFIHGFCVTSERAEVEYKCTDLYDPASELGIAWNDASLGIQWPISDPILSDRDRRNPTLDSLADRLPSMTNL